MSIIIRKNKITKNRFVQIILFLFVILMCTNTYFQIGNIPVFSIFWIFLFLYILFEKENTSYALNNTNSSLSKGIILVFTIWLSYAFVQLIFISFNWAGTRYFSLIFINITTIIFIISLAKSINTIRLLNKGIIIGLIINLLVAFWEINTNTHLKILSPDYERRFYSIPLSFFSNANDFSTFLLFATLVLNIEKVLTRNKIYKLFLYLILLLTILVIFETQSRAGINGIILYFLLYALLRITGKTVREKRDMYIIYSLIMFILSITLLMFLIANYILTLTSIGFEQELDGRLELWEQAFALFLDSYLLGIGPGQSLILMSGNVHFLLLELLVEYGIFIFVGLTTVFVTLIKLVYPFVNSKINSLIASFLICFIPISISSSSMVKIYAVWTIIGIIYALKIYENNKNEQYRA